MTAIARQTIELAGVCVHNLQHVNLSLPLGKLIVISGVSGSGKSSLAIDTLYAEGQRRYIETFSAYARQFLDRLEQPAADRIDNIPPAIAIRQGASALSAKATVATTTEIHDYLRLLFAKVGRVVCPNCDGAVRAETPETVFESVRGFAAGARFQVAFPVPDFAAERLDDSGEVFSRLREEGFGRVIVDGKTIELSSVSNDDPPADSSTDVWVVVDRLVAGRTDDDRLRDSLELAFLHGDERCLLLVEGEAGTDAVRQWPAVTIDDRPWRVFRFDARLRCSSCDREFLAPEPRLFSFNTPLGACPACRGFGRVPSISFERLVPDRSKSLREGALPAWTTPAYRHELDELLALADDYNLPVDVAFSELQPADLELIANGVPERDFGGLRGFFDWLERHRYKLGVRVFLNRWRTYQPCDDCNGDRLQPQARAVHVAGLNIAEMCRLTVGEALAFFAGLDDRFEDDERKVSRLVVSEIRSRLQYLDEIGLSYLSLDRTMKTLSGGEAQRVALTCTLGSSLVNTLYVLDEPSAGLHPRDSRRVIEAIFRLRDIGNTVVVVEHEDAFVTAAEELVDMGPGAGKEGGRIVYQGPPSGVTAVAESITGAYLSGRLSIAAPETANRRQPRHGKITLYGARQHNLKNVTVEFPLGLLCVVTGVSGSGKSSLVEQTLFPAVCRVLGQPCEVESTADYDRITGTEQVDEVILVDQGPIGRTPRSNAVTYMKAFAAIRTLFAATQDARLRSFKAKAFSFNAAGGGRCAKCAGHGSIKIEMHFLADVSMTCPECQGTRFRREIMEIKYRGLTIAEVLDLTVGEAFTFFRNHRQVLKKLKCLKDVGLDYLPLGQPATTLSGGESQRLKLASFLASGTRSRTLFLIDEPTTGLHTADVARLLQCFAGLVAVGHSLIVVEHNLDLIRAADWVIDLGPDAGENGGSVVAVGNPEAIATADLSITGEYLRGETFAAGG